MNQLDLKEKAPNGCQAKKSQSVLRAGKQPIGTKRGKTANRC